MQPRACSFSARFLPGESGQTSARPPADSATPALTILFDNRCRYDRNDSGCGRIQLGESACATTTSRGNGELPPCWVRTKRPRGRHSEEPDDTDLVVHSIALALVPGNSPTRTTHGLPIPTAYPGTWFVLHPTAYPRSIPSLRTLALLCSVCSLPALWLIVQLISLHDQLCGQGADKIR